MGWMRDLLWRKLIGPPNTRLDWDLLKTLLRDESHIEVYDIKELESSKADIALQFQGGGESVKYFRKRNEAPSIPSCRTNCPTGLTAPHSKLCRKKIKIQNSGRIGINASFL